MPKAKAPKPKLKFKIPKEVGGAIDLLFNVREERRKLDAQAKSMKEQESMIEDAIFKGFAKSKLEGARGRLALATIERSDVPSIKQWEKFAAHIKKTGALDLLQRRISVEAFRERLAAKKTVPGVEVFTRVSLSLTRNKQSIK